MEKDSDEKKVGKDRPLPRPPPVPERRVLAAVNPGSESFGSRDHPKVGQHGGNDHGGYDMEVCIGCKDSGMVDSATNFKIQILQ